MKSNDIRKLAKLSISGNNINQDAADYAINYLTRKNMSAYLNFLKLYSEKRTVKVISENSLPEALKRQIRNLFEEKNVIFSQEKIGDGIRIQISDTIIDFTLPGLIDMIIGKLKYQN